MMKYLGLLAAVALSVSMVGTAAAQQMPQPLPTNGTGGTHHVTVHQDISPLRFPATAARYEVFVSFMLDGIRKMSTSRGVVTQGDINKMVLQLKECAARVEANGTVTSAENASCIGILRTSLREIRNSPQALAMLHP
jgi:hypothetical protein